MRDRLLSVVGELLAANPYGFLVSGTPEAHVRLVHHLSADADGAVWIGTSPRSRKASDIRTEPAVVYAVEDRPRFAYVTLQCRATLVEDPETLTERWTPGLATFFPGGPTGGDFVLARLQPWRIELMSFADGIHPDPYGLVPAVLTREAGGGWE